MLVWFWASVVDDGPAPRVCCDTAKHCTLNNIVSSEGTLQYYYHATPGEPWVCMIIVLNGFF